jgi:hypothetical protein
MSFKKTLKREMEVALSRKSQPVWFRILKYILLAVVIYLFWGTRYLWTILLILLVFAICLHFWYRYKTHGWTRSYGLWKYDKNETRESE